MTMQKSPLDKYTSLSEHRQILPHHPADHLGPVDHPDPLLPTSIRSPACRRCRQQKLKCDRTRPTCSRCRKQNAPCSYPPSSAQRRRRGWRDSRPFVSGDLVAGTAGGRAPPQPRENVSSTTDSRDRRGDRSPSVSVSFDKGLGPENRASASDDLLPPRAVGLALLEIYFSHIYNANLLFHKPTLFQKYLEDTVPHFLLRSIFSLSTLFLVPSDRLPTANLSDLSELALLRPYYGCGHAWAEAATREVFTLTPNTPSLSAVQTLGCLTLYRFAIGEPKSADLTLALAYRCCSLSAYNRLFVDSNSSATSMFDIELRRRCLWACWASCCVACQPKTVIRSAWLEVAELPLPATISSTLVGYSVELNEKMSSDWYPMTLDVGNGQTRSDEPFGLLIKLLGIWAKIQLLASDGLPYAEKDGLDEFETLHRRLLFLYNSNPLLYGSPFNDEHPISDRTSDLVLIRTLYSLCQMVLHSTVLRFFLGPRGNQSMVGSNTESTAEAVLHHADLVTDILNWYLSKRLDPSKLYPLVGYAASVAGLVLSASAGEKCCGNHHSADMRRIRTAVLILDGIKTFWKPLQHQYEVVKRAALSISSYREQHALRLSTNYSLRNPRLDRCRLPSQKMENLCSRLSSAIASSIYVDLELVSTQLDTSTVTNIADANSQLQIPQELPFPDVISIADNEINNEINNEISNVRPTGTNDELDLNIDAVQHEDNWWDITIEEISPFDLL